MILMAALLFASSHHCRSSVFLIWPIFTPDPFGVPEGSLEGSVYSIIICVFVFCFAYLRNVHSRSAGRPTIQLLKEQGEHLSFCFHVSEQFSRVFGK